MSSPLAEPWTHHEAVVNGVRLHWVEQGAGPLVVLLHGFPEFWYSWRRQIPALAEAGFRPVAPDMRGYNLSEKPKRGYDLRTLTDDILALIRHLREERATVIGHDWGGLIAWAAAIRHPDAVEKLVVMNAPHPGRFLEEIRRPRQFLRSMYALFFRIPALPELVLGARRAALSGRMLRRTAVEKAAFSDEDIERYREAISRPGALTAALSYYRSARLADLPAHYRVSCPTLLLWGDHDLALGRPLASGLERWVPNLAVHHFDCGHWVNQERSAEINRYLLEFLRDANAGSSPGTAPLEKESGNRP